ncbi:hypothetical protein QWJ20_09615 [Pectobacterium sp. S5]|uniref:hypothetical protein n=1 Tax=Pectobacterium TaxID=122277 RepID=UPI003D9AD14F
MKSEYIKIAEFYKILRDYYINTFPERVSDKIDRTATFKKLVIDHLNNKFIDAKIEPVNGVYQITGSIVEAYKKSAPPEGSTAYLIAKLSESGEIKKLLASAAKDLADLDFWLGVEGYVKNGLASEKLFMQKEWSYY